MVTGDMIGDIGAAYVEAFGERDEGDAKGWKGVAGGKGGKL